MSSELWLNTSIFQLDKIKEAIEAYSEIVKIKIDSDNDEYYQCQFDESIYPMEITISEFENYVIGLMGKNDY